MAELNYREQKYDDVIAIVADLKKRDPNSPFLYQAEEVLGRSYKQRAPTKFDEARAAFERVLANPFAKGTETAAKAQFLIGDTWFHQQKYDEALAAYQKVFSLHEDYPEWRAEALLSSARCDENQKDWKQAVETYQLLIKTFPAFHKIEQAKSKLEEARKRIGG
jgi:TolA-binding protein